MSKMQNKSHNIALGRAISVSRAAQTMSSEALAARAEIGIQRLQQVESGNASITLIELRRVANCLNVDPLELCQLADYLLRDWRAVERDLKV